MIENILQQIREMVNQNSNILVCQPLPTDKISAPVVHEPRSAPEVDEPRNAPVVHEPRSPTKNILERLEALRAMQKKKIDISPNPSNKTV